MKIGIIGGGRLGSCLAEYFFQKNILIGITANSANHTEELAEKFKTEITDNIKLVEESEVIFITVADGKIAALAECISKSVPAEIISKKMFFHCSGSLGLEPLNELKNKGAKIGSIHPLQSFAGGYMDLTGTYMAVDGDNEAVSMAENVIEILGGKSFKVPAEERALYHAVACMCSNYMVALEFLAQNIMSRWMPDNDKSAAWEALKPIFQGTANNMLKFKQANTALTGPISRGDIGTVEKHLQYLPQEIKALYCQLGLLTVETALTNETIQQSTADKLKKLLSEQ